MRLGITALLLIALTACSEAEQPASSPSPTADPSPTKAAAPAPAMDAVDLWSLCAGHAEDQVSGDWSFPYSSDVAVTGRKATWTVTGPVNGPADQTFELSCTYTDVTSDSARLKTYNLL